MDAILEYAMNIILALAIFFVGKWLVGEVTNLIIKGLRKSSKLDETLVVFFKNIIYYALLIVVILTALKQVGIETTSFLAILGAAGLAIGLALKDSLSNFASGVMIVFFKPFKIGDFVTAGGVSGTITEIHLFNTEFKTGDNQKILVPNSSITSGSIINVNAHDKRRVDLLIGVGYEDDIKKVKELLTSIVASHEKILQDEANKIAVSELADSSVNFIVRAWVNTPDYWDVRFELIETIKTQFDQEGITIPYPQTDVHVYKEKK
ncbi:MAG: mechanosensitive ion channel [Arcobacteraceae bacterium]|jgi:small conductance mechanosensitive channel|nr:mechanosensitive ion channel [Arcobacteraceae bacterium]